MTAPLFSIITPVYNPPAAVLEAMLRSVTEQTFASWEHCLVDDRSTQPHVREILDRARRADPRLRVVHRAANGGIAAASNEAIGLAAGEFVALLDHDDELAPDALRCASEALARQPEADYLYTDEELIDPSGVTLALFTKPDWSPERLRTQMYVLHLSVLRRSLVQEVGGFDPDLDGSQDWDLVLRVTERARRIVHVPEVLYRWRAVAGSTARDGMAAKPWAFSAATRAIQGHCDRIGLEATVVADDTREGVYHLEPNLSTTPLVSIVIPTGGQVREVWAEPRLLVAHCVESVVRMSTYPDYEIVVVIDDQVDPAVIQEVQAVGGGQVRFVMGERPFNFSDRVNTGACASRGEHLLLLNDDMEVITPDWIARMVMYTSLEGVGAVGAKLVFGDGRLQHMGVIFHGRSPGHLYRGFSPGFRGYWADVAVANNYMAVTGACLMVRQDVFEEVGGLATSLPLNYNDVDFCLKLRAAGYRVVWDPDAVLYHFESSSRETDVADWEHQILMDRWEPEISRDPYYNPERLLPVGDSVRVELESGSSV